MGEDEEKAHDERLQEEDARQEYEANQSAAAEAEAQINDEPHEPPMRNERELKFRAWDVEEKKMTTEAPFLNMAGKKIYCGFDGDEEETHEYIIMQFTGIKDKNGKEIYEGDIVKEIDEGKFKPALIGVISFGIQGVDEWSGRAVAGFWIKDKNDGILMPYHHEDISARGTVIEVIGNIYELRAAIEKLGGVLQNIADERMKALDPLVQELVKLAKENPELIK